MSWNLIQRVELLENEEKTLKEQPIISQGLQTEKPHLRIPRIVTAHKRILVMECVSGARLDDLKYMEQHKISTAEVSSCLSHIFSDMIFTPNVGLHCDPHGGNLAIRALDHKSNGHNFEIILYDHGLYRQIPLQMKRDYPISGFL